ncbi:MAG: PHP-associated domain-containing protein [Bacteroidales bacterium]
MRLYRADLHIHTVLSPCGDLCMSPVNIIDEAVRARLDIIGITDHNTTRHCRVVSRLAEKAGIHVMKGAEITTREEIHCLTFFESFDTLDRFQTFIDEHLPDIENVPAIFGDQVQVDENDVIIYTERKLLHNALDIPIEDLEQFVHSLGGLFIPAHVDRQKNSIYSQLGLYPEGLNADAVEISRRTRPDDFLMKHPELQELTIVRNSDAHLHDQIGKAATGFELERASFDEIRQAMRSENGRKVVPV